LHERGYEKQIAVNLVGEEGRELPVKLAYDKLMDMLAMKDVKYIHFNFHGESGNLTLDKLFDLGKDDFKNQGYPSAPLPSYICTNQVPITAYFLFG
jgi:hypothetical protein